jgi:hypothetical protein
VQLQWVQIYLCNKADWPGYLTLSRWSGMRYQDRLYQAQPLSLWVATSRSSTPPVEPLASHRNKLSSYKAAARSHSDSAFSYNSGLREDVRVSSMELGPLQSPR